ncbi:hypothetical protein Z947_2703 [Sulfitobacter geojensis]|nr:hypothetical protein Z947_2703 [Sulfitobacter geojensis]
MVFRGRDARDARTRLAVAQICGMRSTQPRLNPTPNAHF